MVHSVRITELKLEISTIDIVVWKELPEGTTNSIWIPFDHLKSIVSVCWRFIWNWFHPFSQVEIVCRFHRDCVSILPGVHWSSAQI